MSMDRHFDLFGYIVVGIRDDRGDGGDSAHNHGLYRFGRWIKLKDKPELVAREQFKFQQELDGLEDPNRKNYYRRHPDPAQWWSRSNNFTRDQQRPLVIAMGALNQRKRLFGMFWEHIKRFGFYQNNRHPDESRGWKIPDFAAPNHWGEYIRAFHMAGIKGMWILYPLLVICDLFGLIGGFLNKSKWEDPDNADDDNMIISHLQAKFSMPTPFSWLSRTWYIKNRSIAGFIDGEKKEIPLRLAPTVEHMTGPESAMAWKHRPATGAPPLYEFYKEILNTHMR